MKVNGKDYRTVWMEKSAVMVINQRLLPHKFEIKALSNHIETAEAIRDMTVRGAGAIGAAAGYGMAQVFLEAPSEEPRRSVYIQQGYERLKNTRPTAKDLFYAIERVKQAGLAGSARDAVAEAERIADNYIRAAELIGKYGAELISDGMTILTHCNAGWLAFVDWGSALAPIYFAHRADKKVSVIVDETRPRCQGARLTAWELQAEGIAVKIIADNAAGFLMRRGQIDIVITGADRIAANGDVANKIGTYEKALCAKANGIPFYVAAPASTFDLDCANGWDIPIEQRHDDEVLYANGLSDSGQITRVRIAPQGVGAINLAFDVTPAELIDGIITEYGIIKPTPDQIEKIMNERK